MSKRRLINNIRFLKRLFSELERYPYVPPYIEIYLSELGIVEWAINRLEPDPIKVKDFFGSAYESYGYLYITDMPFLLYDAISLVYNIDKNKIKNMILHKNGLNEEVLISQFSQATDFYFKQKKVYKYIRDKQYSNIYHTLDFDTGISFLKLIFKSYTLNDIEKVHTILMAIDLLKEGYKSAFGIDDPNLRWNSHMHEKLYFKSSYSYLFSIISLLLDFSLEFNKTFSPIFKEIKIFSERLPWKRKINIHLTLTKTSFLYITIKNRGKAVSGIYLFLTVKPSKTYYEKIRHILKDFFGEKVTLNKEILTVSKLFFSSLDDLMISLKSLLKTLQEIK